MARSAAASFLGSHTNRIDAKGRVAAPAEFRKALDLKSFNGFFCVPSLLGDHLDCGGPDFIEDLKATISTFPKFDPRRRALEVSLLGQARPIMFDQDGRFILPKEMRDFAKVGDEAHFVGHGETFEIRRVEGVTEELADARTQAREALELLNDVAWRPNGGGE